jgi:cell division protein DivIC
MASPFFTFEHMRKIEPKRILKNKYLWITLGFGVWMLFLDSNSWLFLRKLNKEIETLKESHRYYEEEMEKDSTLLYEFEHNPEAREKYAREQYKMKKEKEDLFIIKEEK